MAKEITRTVLTHESDYVINKDLLNELYFNRCQMVTSDDHRDKAAEERPAIFVTTSGMMQGGPAMHYLGTCGTTKRTRSFLTGYQVEGTNGRRLLEEGYVFINGMRTNVRCEVQKFDFSGHADIEDIKKVVWQVNPKRLIMQHGDTESVTNMVAWAKAETPFEVYGPDVGDKIDL